MLFEARAATPRALTLAMVLLLAGLVVTGSVFSFLLGVLFAVYWPYSGRIILRIREDGLEHLSFGGAGRASVFDPMSTSNEHLYRIRASDVRELAWDGFDNIGIRLGSGDVVCVDCRLLFKAEERGGVRAAILAFVERATGQPIPQREDVAPWLLQKAPRSSA